MPCPDHSLSKNPHLPTGATKLLTIKDFRKNGTTVAKWAKSHGFAVGLVYKVLGGRKALRGESHRIARALGMK